MVVNNQVKKLMQMPDDFRSAPMAAWREEPEGTCMENHFTHDYENDSSLYPLNVNYPQQRSTMDTFTMSDDIDVSAETESSLTDLL